MEIRNILTWRWLDPDRRVWAKDKLQHALLGFVLCAGLDLAGASEGQALGLTVAAGAIYEAGQTDTAHSTGKLGQAGFGFGVVDLGADTVGALVWLLVKVFFRGWLGV